MKCDSCTIPERVVQDGVKIAPPENYLINGVVVPLAEVTTIADGVVTRVWRAPDGATYTADADGYRPLLPDGSYYVGYDTVAVLNPVPKTADCNGGEVAAVFDSCLNDALLNLSIQIQKMADSGFGNGGDTRSAESVVLAALEVQAVTDKLKELFPAQRDIALKESSFDAETSVLTLKTGQATNRRSDKNIPVQFPTPVEMVKAALGNQELLAELKAVIGGDDGSSSVRKFIRITPDMLDMTNGYPISLQEIPFGETYNEPPIVIPISNRSDAATSPYSTVVFAVTTSGFKFRTNAKDVTSNAFYVEIIPKG